MITARLALPKALLRATACAKPLVKKGDYTLSELLDLPYTNVYASRYTHTHTCLHTYLYT